MAVINDDKTLLKVKGNIEDREERKIYLKNLSKALFTVIQKHGVARLRCIGVPAVCNAVKSHIIANGEAARKGTVLVSVPSFSIVTFSDNQEKTAVVIEIREVKEFV